MRGRRTAAQLSLAIDRRRPEVGRGGWRRRAGRKKGRPVTHDRRPAINPRHPLHVTLTVRPDCARLRRRNVFQVVRACLAASRRATFRVREFSVQSPHVLLVCEADGAVELTRGIQGLATRMARRINGRLGRRGKAFADRYHARAMRTPREVRSGLRYVLQNARHHGDRRPFDPCSSAASFAGWARPLLRTEARMREALAARPVTAPARTWLLTVGWRRGGTIEPDEDPAG